jgi:hypothetical protein
MKKMPTLYKRIFVGHDIKDIENEITPGCEWVENGKGTATLKLDGTCCLIKEGKIYARFDFKAGRNLPEGAIPCQDEADPITGHFPHWVEVTDQPQYKYHKIAFENFLNTVPDYEDGTYELCGPHFNGNHEKYKDDILIKHGSIILPEVPRTFEGIKEYLKEHYIEGIVFHYGDKMCKIKRSDFGFQWRQKNF